jgi:GNAT superfamily N-acetyltransferase
MMKQSDVSLSLHAERQIPAEKLKTLYDSEPWWPERALEDLQIMLDRYPAIGVWAGDNLIGFARAVTDSRFRANIEDVLVLKEYREHGIGTRIMNGMMEYLKDIDVVTLFCQRKLVAYYEALGFKEFTRQAVMQKRNSLHVPPLKDQCREG